MVRTNSYLSLHNLFRFGGKEWSKAFSDYDFGARYHSTDHCRFSTMDPLAEKYYHLSPYAYCNGNPVRYVDLFGMEGVKYDDGAGGYIIESNIVVLTEEAIQITDFMTERERKSAERKNLRIERRNDRLISTIQQSLESTFINSKGENGENVSFHFNVIPVATSNPFVSRVSSVHELSTSYGIAAYTPNRVGFGEGVALATVISQASTYALGETKGGILICLSSYAPSTIAHEIGHTLYLTHPIGGSVCGLMHYPPESLSSNEVSIILQNAFQKK